MGTYPTIRTLQPLQSTFLAIHQMDRIFRRRNHQIPFRPIRDIPKWSSATPHPQHPTKIWNCSGSPQFQSVQGERYGHSSQCRSSYRVSFEVVELVRYYIVSLNHTFYNHCSDAFTNTCSTTATKIPFKTKCLRVVKNSFSRRGVLSAVISRHGCSAYLIPLLAVVRSSVGHAVNWLNPRYFACEPRILPESSTEIQSQE